MAKKPQRLHQSSEVRVGLMAGQVLIELVLSGNGEKIQMYLLPDNAREVARAILEEADNAEAGT